MNNNVNEEAKENSEELDSKRISPIPDDDEFIILHSQKVTFRLREPEVDISQSSTQRLSVLPADQHLEPAIVDQTELMTIGGSNINLANEPIRP